MNLIRQRFVADRNRPEFGLVRILAKLYLSFQDTQGRSDLTPSLIPGVRGGEMKNYADCLKDWAARIAANTAANRTWLYCSGVWLFKRSTLSSRTAH